MQAVIPQEGEDVKRILVRCVCGDKTLWTQDVDDGKPKMTVQEGIGEEQDCCKAKMKAKRK